MKIVAVTGGVGSGKTLVVSFFKELGLPVVSCDQLAHNLMKPMSEAWKKLVGRFGKEILSSDNKIDGAKLASIIFHDFEEKKFVEELMHPLVHDALSSQITRIKNDGGKIAVIEVPLLFEVGWEREMDAVIVVVCAPSEQLNRCRKGLGWDEDTIKLAIESMISQDAKALKADYVIDNSGSVEDTKKQVKNIFYILSASFS